MNADSKFVFLFLLSGVIASLGLRSLFRRLDRLLISLIEGELILPKRKKIRINFAAFIQIYEIYVLKCYEMVFPIRVEDTVVDVGRSIGIFTVKACQSTREVVAIEPNRRAFALMLDNLKRKSIRSVIPINMPLGSRETERMTTLDCVVRLGRSRINLLKIDVKAQNLMLSRVATRCFRGIGLKD